jgi:molecular chaperone GrpE
MTPPYGPFGGARDPGEPGPGHPGAPRWETTVDPRVEPVGPAGTPGLGATDDDDVLVESANDTVVGDLDDLVVAARRERDEFRDMVQRVQADFENYKKRMVRQQTDHLERAAEDLVTKVLPVLDAFDLARAHLGEGDNVSPEGKALVAGSTLLADTLAREGLERIGVPGEPFDPTTHEAVDRVPDDATAVTGIAGTAGVGAEVSPGAGEAAPQGPVVDGVLRAGYLWKGRVIRPAMVRVRG